MKIYFGTVVTRAITVVALLFPLCAAAQTESDKYPGKQIRFICPWPPGGATDFVSRFFALRMTDALGQQVFVDNRGGAAGIIGTELGARAPADGYTLTFANLSVVAINPFLYNKLSYDPVRDFAPVIELAEGVILLLVHPSVPAKSLRELIELAKARPGSLNLGSPGSGTYAHLGGEMINTMAGIKLVHVPYKGSGAGLTALIAGETQVYIEPFATSIQHVRAGRLRAIAVTSSRRTSLLPELPTMIESGLPGYNVGSWYGILVPAATPRQVVLRLNEVVNRIVNLADVKERLAADAILTVGGTPEAFGSKMKIEMARWGQVVKDTGAKAD